MRQTITRALIITCLAVTALQADDAPTRIHYFGNSLTDQLKYD